MLDIFSRFFLILNTSDAKYDALEEIITLYPNEDDSSFLSANDFKPTNIQNSGVQIETKKLAFKFYWNDDEFLTKYSNVQNLKEQNIFVYNSNKSLFRLYLNNQEYQDTTIVNTFFFVNAITYIEFISLLKEKSISNEDDFHFIDNFDQSSKRFLITSSKEPGKLLLPIPESIVTGDMTINKSSILNDFNIVFEPTNKNLPIFLKNEIYAQLKNVSEQDRIKYLFENFLNVNKIAEKNFETFIHDFSIDTLKKDYDDYKKNYFELISDVIGKITNQFIALPITVATAAFTITRVESSLFSCTLIIGALIGSSIYLSFLLLLYKKDLSYFSEAVENDYAKISKNKFFEKHSEEIKDFNIIKDNLLFKIRIYKRLTYVYFLLMWLFNTLLVYLIFYLKLKESYSIISFSLVAILINIGLMYLFESNYGSGKKND